MTYEEVYKDHQRLWAAGEAYDMTGGYVDSEDLERMLKSPTKRMAKHCLLRQIDYWFDAGTEGDGLRVMRPEQVVPQHPEIWDLAEKYGYGHLIPKADSAQAREE